MYFSSLRLRFLSEIGLTRHDQFCSIRDLPKTRWVAQLGSLSACELPVERLLHLRQNLNEIKTWEVKKFPPTLIFEPTNAPSCSATILKQSGWIYKIAGLTLF